MLFCVSVASSKNSIFLRETEKDISAAVKDKNLTPKFIVENIQEMFLSLIKL